MAHMGILTVSDFISNFDLLMSQTYCINYHNLFLLVNIVDYYTVNLNSTKGQGTGWLFAIMEVLLYRGSFS